MSLILRRDKGEDLTMDELDDNLVYLEQNGGGGGVKSLHYIAALSKSGGTDAPTATVTRNDFDNPVVWSRTGIGKYIGTLTGIGIGDVRIVPPNNTTSAQTGQKYLVTACGVASDNEIYLNTSVVDSDTGIATPSDGDPDVGETTLEGVGYSYIEIIKYL